MDVETAYVVVNTTVDSRERADAMATMMVAEGIAACVHILEVNSVYRWQGHVETAEEFRLEAKTSAALADTLMAFIRKAHPYDTPEVIALPILKGDARYLDWLRDSTTQRKENT